MPYKASGNRPQALGLGKEAGLRPAGLRIQESGQSRHLKSR